MKVSQYVNDNMHLYSNKEKKEFICKILMMTKEFVELTAYVADLNIPLDALDDLCKNKESPNDQDTNISNNESSTDLLSKLLAAIAVQDKKIMISISAILD